VVLLAAVASLMTGAAAVTVQHSQALSLNNKTLKSVDKLKKGIDLGCTVGMLFPLTAVPCAYYNALEFGWNLGQFMDKPSVQTGSELLCSPLASKIPGTKSFCDLAASIGTVNDLLSITCPDGSVIPADQTCPSTNSQDNSNPHPPSDTGNNPPSGSDNGNSGNGIS